MTDSLESTPNPNIICVDCKKAFNLTSKEIAFYEDRGLILPKRCSDCRQKKKIEKAYLEISKKWSVEAKKEPLEYFYNVDEMAQLQNGEKTFVIGRKGSGKTSIAQHLNKNNPANSFSRFLSFKNFPFQILYSLENSREYTTPNQYISIWKYLIYSKICTMMIHNENIDITIRTKLSKLYNDDSSQALDKLIKKWTSTGFGVEILGCGFNIAGEQYSKDLSWLEIVDILENIIIDYCDKSTYYIIFDELDEDYKNFPSVVEANRYKDMITSLFKCICDIRSKFKDEELLVYPIAFLRSDIYDQITDSDKNKWYESVINLEWNTDKIKRLLAHRICVAFSVPDKPFDEAWSLLFSRDMVKMGTRKTKEMAIYDYIERSTEMRPRDFIKYIQECVILANKKAEHPITPETVKDSDENFSEYLKRETIDELYAILPEISDIFGLLSTIRKQRFSFSDFEIEYNNQVDQGILPPNDVKRVLLMLFDAGVIGNIPRIKTKSIFKFSGNSPRFNYNETMIIHRGLFKSLQIF